MTDPSHKQVQASNEPMQTSLNSSEVESNANSISYQKYSDVRCLDLFGEWRRCVCESCHARKRDWEGVGVGVGAQFRIIVVRNDPLFLVHMDNHDNVRRGQNPVVNKTGN